MKIGLFRFIGLLFVFPTMIHADRGHCDRDCDQKLDALSKTLFRVGNTASLVETSLNQYQTDCCESCADILRNRATQQCFCTTTTIYGPTMLTESGAYCLANDITGNISTVGVQVSIDLKGHVVDGNVGVDEHGYVYNGTITGSLVLPSYSRAEQVTVGGTLQGAGGQNVLIRDSVLTNTNTVVINNFESLVLDRCSLVVDGEVYPSTFNVQNTANLTLRDCYALGDMWVDFGSPVLESFAFYDSRITGELYLYVNNLLQNVTALDSSINRLYVDFIDAGGTPSLFLHGITGSSAFFVGLSGQPHQGTRIFVDECALGRLNFQRVSNVHCQNTTVQAFDDGAVYNQFASLDISSCQSSLFLGIDAFNPLTTGERLAVKVFDSKNVLFKKCYASSPNYRAFDVAVAADAVGTSTSINFSECVAKDSFYGFYVSGEYTTGYTKNCIADGCTGGFVPNVSSVPTVFSGNVSCFNTINYAVGAGMPPYYDAAYTVTAGSWRNISL